MFYHVDPASGIPIYVQLIGQIKNCIAGGILVPGDRLPSVRELAAQLTVNPNTIQKTYQELEQNGIIETQRGRGTFVCGSIPIEFGQDRVRKLEDMIRALFVEAYHLNFKKEEFLKIFTKELGNWDSFKGGTKNE
jgi:Predicted transcriptional regulators